MSGLTFAPATPADEPLLLELMEEFYRHEGIAWSGERARFALHTLGADPGLGCAWIFRAGAEPAGYLVLTLCYSLEFAGRFALVDELYVREARRGQGIGTRALEIAVEAAAGLDAAAVRLEVDVDNEGAMRLYRRLGFELQERRLMSRWLA